MSSGPALIQAAGAETAVKAVESFGKLPLVFVENRGQFDPRVAYAVQGATTALYFTAGGVTFALGPPSKEVGAASQSEQGLIKTARSPKRDRWVVRLDFLGADPHVEPRAEAPREAVISYFTGPAEQWRTGLKTYAQLRYPELWPGIDLVYSGTVDRLKYHFEVKPGADPRRIRLAYRGASALTATAAGQLEVVTPVRTFHDDRPAAWQEVDGRRVEVSAAYALEPGSAESRPYGFTLGAYDPGRPLLLDPAVIVYAGYIGGSGIEEDPHIAVDAAGNAYVTGATYSTLAFPVNVGPDLTYNGAGDAFVAKVNAAGTELVYAGYIGGNKEDLGHGIAVDAVGNAYVTGETLSTQTSFPVNVGPDLTYNSGCDAFVAKVNAAGTALIYAGYIGGSSNEVGYGIALDAAGNAYVTGGTSSFQTGFPDKIGPDRTYNGNGDAFVAKVNTTGAELVYAGYIGGSSNDYGGDIAVDTAGNAYVTGRTTSTQASFPDKIGPDLTYNGMGDAFVAKVNAAGTELVSAGYIGGSSDDRGDGIAVDAAGNAYVAGGTSSSQTRFPDKIGPDLTYNGNGDAFVAKVNAAGTELVYAGYIGGSGEESGFDIAVDATGNAYVTGYTLSPQTSFPVKVGPDLTHNGHEDAFVAKVNAAGAELVYAGYIGGSGPDSGSGIAVGAAGNAYVAGSTLSTQGTFPVTLGPDLTHNGEYDTFVAKLSAEPVGNSTWSLDANGDGVWNGAPPDRFYNFGLPGDVAVAGDWNGDGDDDIGVKHGANWYLDYNGNGVWNGTPTDRLYTFGLDLDIPIAGDWNGDGDDDIGVKRGAEWYLDYNGNGVWNGTPTDRFYTFGIWGDAPAVGDWNGDGMDDIGVRHGANWYLDYNGDGVWNGTPTDRLYTFGTALDRPVAGNWNGDDVDEIGVQRSNQ
jgi:hypothetical protein